MEQDRAVSYLDFFLLHADDKFLQDRVFRFLSVDEFVIEIVRDAST